MGKIFSYGRVCVNNSIHMSTGRTPFEIVESKPKLPLMVRYLSNVFAADEYSRDLTESFQKVKDAISIAHQKQKLQLISIGVLWSSKRMIGSY